MSLSLSLLGPLALATSPAEAPPETDAISRRFAKVKVTSGACALLGYDVDFDQLAIRTSETRAQLVAAGEDPETAGERMQRDLRREQGRFKRTFGDFLHETAIWPGALLRTHDRSSRGFQFFYTDRCDDLAQSSEASDLISQLDERLSSADLGRRIAAVLIEPSR